MRITYVVLAALILLLMGSATALAQWPGDSQGDQYAAVNDAMETAVAGVGMSPSTFVAIYNAAVTGDVSAYGSEQLAAACQVLSTLSAYESVLEDYESVYNNLGCGSRKVETATATPYRSALPSTGVALGLLVGSGVLGIGAAARMLKKSR